jgi:Protein of unknown function (DUF2442)
MQCPRILKAQAVDNHTLIIEFTNQEVKQYDIRHLLDNPMFALLHQPAFFKSFQVEPGGYGIVWNEDLDLSEYELWKNGVPVAEGKLC